MKKFKKTLALLLAIICIFTCSVSSFALSMSGGVAELKAQFTAGEGPVAGDYSVDYSYFSPVKENDAKKYPLVIWLHGMGDGSEPGKPVEKSNIGQATNSSQDSSLQAVRLFLPHVQEKKTEFSGATK